MLDLKCACPQNKLHLKCLFIGKTVKAISLNLKNLIFYLIKNLLKKLNRNTLYTNISESKTNKILFKNNFFLTNIELID